MTGQRVGALDSPGLFLTLTEGYAHPHAHTCPTLPHLPGVPLPTAWGMVRVASCSSWKVRRLEVARTSEVELGWRSLRGDQNV